MDWEQESRALRAKRGLADYQPLKPFVAQRTAERSLWYEGQLVVIYGQGEDVGHTCSVWEGNVPQDVGPPPHIHLYEHELFFVIEGQLRAWVEGVEHIVPKDSMIFMPCGRMHWFVSAAARTRMLSMTVTAEKAFPNINNNVGLFKFMGQPARSLDMPELDGVDTLPSPAEIVKVSQAAGSDFPDLERMGWRRGFGDGSGSGIA
ncbi:cupin domain-containing protein [Achromobacter pestifer]